MTDVSEYVTEEGIPVLLPSGSQFPVLTQSEAEYLTDRASRYLSDQIWVNVSDLQDVDRMLIFELLIYRMGLFVARGLDYFGDPIEAGTLRKSMIEMTRELRLLKQTLQVDKKSREASRGADSTAALWENLRRRALEFGIHRDEQTAKAIELINDLIAFRVTMKNADDQEKKELHVTEKDFFEWIDDRLIPEFQAVDAAFRVNQRMWIRDL